MGQKGPLKNEAKGEGKKSWEKNNDENDEGKEREGKKGKDQDRKQRSQRKIVLHICKFSERYQFKELHVVNNRQLRTR